MTPPINSITFNPIRLLTRSTLHWPTYSGWTPVVMNIHLKLHFMITPIYFIYIMANCTLVSLLSAPLSFSCVSFYSHLHYCSPNLPLNSNRTISHCFSFLYSLFPFYVLSIVLFFCMFLPIYKPPNIVWNTCLF